jgi:hypothetical protein
MAMLGGQQVDYTTMYEAPARTTSRRSWNDDDGGRYDSVNTDDSV